MRRFRFSLEKLLRLREQAVEEAKRALAEAFRRVEEARSTLSDRESALQGGIGSLAERETAGLVAGDFAVGRQFLRHLQADRVCAEGELNEAMEWAERRRGELLTANQSHKALERLRELRYEEYVADLLHQEQKELDEYGARPGLNQSGLMAEI